ncbi:hypothetical protein HOY80DRAFT_1044263 [Tuber brumale]|nr:hypothetical protein HOY80DRAFT_1044263 [Tuber brumale]
MIRSTFKKGRAHPRATIIHPVETLAAIPGVVESGKFTPPNRGDVGVKPSGYSFGRTKWAVGPDIYSGYELDCSRRHVESCERKVGSDNVETPVEAEEGPEWWEIEECADSHEEWEGEDSGGDSDHEGELLEEEDEQELDEKDLGENA